MVIAAQVCEYTKNLWIVYFKWVNSMVCELYLNKMGILKKIQQMGKICRDEEEHFNLMASLSLEGFGGWRELLKNK